jgi:malonate-semialdehyde dehydrogenase (acetylating)/methylmalonate-semialdehyde dehydrogenase
MKELKSSPNKVLCRNLIAGRWDPALHLKMADVQSPSSGQVIGCVPLSGAVEVDAAVTAARSAWPLWASTPVRNRAEVLRRFKLILQENMQRLVETVSSESGKTAVEAEAGLQKGIEIIDFAVSVPNLDTMDSAEVSQGVVCQFRRESLGVVAGITPFNFPAMVPLWMIPLALVTGNAFILKPSEKVPLTSQLLAEFLQQAGIPDGIFSIVNGGAEVVDALTAHPLVSAVGFVGSSTVASHVYTRGAQHHKRVLALGGAKNHIIVTPDCDLEHTAKGIVSSFTGCAGQRCMAASVLLAVGDVEHVIKRAVDLASQLRLGTDMGAIIDSHALARIKSSIEHAVEQGCNLILDGRGRLPDNEALSQGYWMGASIIDGAKPDMDCAQTEIFGPVLTIIRVASLEEAISISNRSPYGNAASVFTTRGDVAQYVAQHSNAGMIGINIGVPVPREPFSFGGTKLSRFGHGDVTGKSGLDFWSDLKKVTTTWPGVQAGAAHQLLLHTT